MTNYEKIRNNITIDHVYDIVEEDAIEWSGNNTMCEQCAEDNGGECPCDNNCFFSLYPNLTYEALNCEAEGFNFKDFLKEQELI